MVDWVTANAPPEYAHGEGLTAKKICELARTGDPVALKAADHEGRYLGLGLANLVTMFAPDAIVLGGSLMKSAELFLDAVRKIIVQSCKLVPYDKAELVLASLGDDSNLIGAAYVWHHRFAVKAGQCA